MPVDPAHLLKTKARRFVEVWAREVSFGRFAKKMSSPLRQCRVVASEVVLKRFLDA